MKSMRLSLKSIEIPTALLIGGDGEDDDKDDKSKAGGAGGDDGDKSKGDDDKDDKSKSDPAQRKIAALEEEKNRHFDAAKVAKQERDDALKRLKEIEDAGKDDNTKAQERLVELETATENLTKTNQRLALENAFLKDNQFEWQDPDVALRLADLSKVEIGKDGTVTGMKDVLKALATSSPYLLKPKSDDAEDDKVKKDPKHSGDPAGRNRGQAPLDDAAKKAALRRKYSALRGRG